MFRTDPDLNHIVTEKIKCSPSRNWNFLTMYGPLFVLDDLRSGLYRNSV